MYSDIMFLHSQKGNINAWVVFESDILGLDDNNDDNDEFILWFGHSALGGSAAYKLGMKATAVAVFSKKQF